MMSTGGNLGTDGVNNKLESPENESSSSSAAVPVHMYPITGNVSHAFRSKRRQVKNACTNCQKSCKKCDEARPCLRCVRYGVHEECVDSPRKERKKGAKRGPYKKRDRGPSREKEPDPSTPQIGLVGQMPFGTMPVGYVPGFYTQFSVPSGKREDRAFCPPFYLAPAPALHPQAANYPPPPPPLPPPQNLPAAFMTPVSHHYPPYGQIMPSERQT